MSFLPNAGSVVRLADGRVGTIDRLVFSEGRGAVGALVIIETDAQLEDVALVGDRDIHEVLYEPDLAA